MKTTQIAVVVCFSFFGLISCNLCSDHVFVSNTCSLDERNFTIIDHETITKPDTLGPELPLKKIKQGFQNADEHLSPLLVYLSKLEDLDLSADHLPIAEEIAKELKKNYAFLMEYIFRADQVPGLFSRLTIVETKSLTCRFHVYDSNASETFIHNHQTSFISCNVAGGYQHNVYSVEHNNGTYYTQTRLTGGILTEIKPKNGTIQHILSQPFQEGQCLFFSANGFHTVKASDSPTVTLIIKSKNKRHEGATVLSPTSTIDAPLEPVIDLNSTETRDLTQTVMKFLSRESPAAHEEAIKTRKQELERLDNKIISRKDQLSQLSKQIDEREGELRGLIQREEQMVTAALEHRENEEHMRRNYEARIEQLQHQLEELSMLRQTERSHRGWYSRMQKNVAVPMI